MAKKKRYYQSSKAGYAEKEFYAGFEERKRMELEDSGMIKEDRSAIANLPQYVMFKEYPRTDYYKYNLDDTQRMVDNQMDEDVMGGGRRKASEKYPEKY